MRDVPDPSPGAAAAAPVPRMRGLDALRFLAAGSVLAYHYTGSLIDDWGKPTQVVFPTLSEVTRYGFLGVHVFFVISGLVILMTAWGRDLPAFASSRVARLFPAYWAVVLMTLLLQAFWDGGRSPDLREGLVNLTMLQHGYQARDVQGAFWTLWYELLFYLLVAVFLRVGITRRRVLAFALLVPLIGRLAQGSGSDLLATLALAPYGPFFALGMLLYLVHRDRGDAVVWLMIGLELVLCADYLLGYADTSPSFEGRPISGAVTTAVFGVGVVAVWLVTSGPLRHLDWRLLSWLGALTYPLYLVHGQFGFAVIDVLHDRLPAYAVVVLATSLALALAIAVHHLVERPWAPRLRAAVRSGLERD